MLSLPYASAYYHCRAVTRNQLKELKVQVEKYWKAAALASNCQLKITWSSGPCDGGCSGFSMVFFQ